MPVSGLDFFDEVAPFCMPTVKKYYCRRSYPECTGIDMNNKSTWNTEVYGSEYPLPYWRACSSMCTDILTACGGNNIRGTS